MSDHDLVSWRAEPDFRGTFSIFSSCMSTLTVCIWSALHVDIQKGKSATMCYLTKAGWLVVGLLCPELLLFTAFNQFWEAVRLTKDGQKMLDSKDTSSIPLLDVETSKRTTSVNENVVRKHPWTLAHGFYAAMGGFVLNDPYVGRSDDHYLPSWQLNGVLTPDGIRFLMQHAPSLIPDLAPDDIRDRSKADGLAKALLVWQVLWFLFNCINRLVQGLPLCLLEISTIAHALCTLLTYGLWWYKPKDIGHPTAIVSVDARPIAAWMSMASLADQYFIGGILQIDYPCEMNHVQIVETHDDDGPRQVSFLRPEPEPGVQHAPSGNSQKKPQTRKKKSLRDALRRAIHTWRLKRIFGGAANFPWYIDGSSENKAEEQARERRWMLAAKAHRQYNLQRPAPESPVRLVVPLASLQASTDTHDHHFTGILRTSLIAAVLAAVYGLPHLIGLSVAFPSATERTLWRVATVLVAFIGVALGGMMVVALGTMVLLDKLLKLLTGAKVGGLAKRAEMTLERTVLSLGAVVYVTSSAYLVVESVRQLFALPPAAFVLPSWSNYWPHFS
ncbi:hypothetical protein L227DRAFT_501145 [Lentinus tigrinus ALCF2SS1-6]|uniref:Uncharacterized protein n=1 Tax=Lentinus tigrinus ALCF2SS1-6 TaxID=1328759 RepID=A0A5C2SCP1_9APHY|nr:hypothetical protein L227DRAFT_501145 [Lentinus tigrinus ALCF2SS1-6]